MESLANLFVTIVTVVHAVVPQANLPQVLGVEVANDSAVVADQEEVEDETEDESEGTQSEDRDTARKRLREAQLEARKKREEIVEEFRVKKQEAVDELKQKREDFKLRLQQITDERKQKIVENIDERLSGLNDKWVGHWNRVLSRLTEILAKISSRAQVLGDGGTDITGVQSSISVAELVIASAQEAVNAQAGKTYVASLTTDANLGQDMKTVVDQFHADIKSVLEKITAARKAVNSALGELKGVAGEND